MILTVAVILTLGSLVFTLFVRGKDVPEAPPVSPTAHLEERKARIYENLRDLQFEYRVGKLSDVDYQKTKLGLQQELAKVLAEIDAIAPAPATKKVAPKPPPLGTTCPHCQAKFSQPLRFCGECGKAMA